ncbi:hypothetical protein OJAV_G00027710 [Oryzias javanicus]|uniref:5-formyltetrahydrofolate cyclo-ligase n=1 Tax=Oryzias javanicus TaxID=123683 RepID=A0A3S2PJ52_ORYJA|nr:hypothetical protein OJAV_G00027710 [Oryzias javanicus]
MDMLRLHSLEDMDALPRTSWNIPQPPDDDSSRESPQLRRSGPDADAGPGLRPGRRTSGAGEGLLRHVPAALRPTPPRKPYTLALAFREQRCEEIPVDAHDVLIDEVLSEEVQ